MSSRADEIDPFVVDGVNQERVAADLAFTMVRPIAGQWMVTPFWPEGGIVRDQSIINRFNARRAKSKRS